MPNLSRFYQKEVDAQVKQLTLHWIFVAWASLLVINAAVLATIYFFMQKGMWKYQDTQLETIAAPVASIIPASPCLSGDCTLTCQNIVDTAIASLAAQTKKTPPVVLPKPVGEYYIPLGAYLGKSFGSWADTGASAYVDLANYPGLKYVYFEISAHIPTANGAVTLRLLQANENVFIPGSELSTTSQSPQILSSGPLKLFSGNKLYKVQIKNSMDYEAVVDFARLKIVL